MYGKLPQPEVPPPCLKHATRDVQAAMQNDILGSVNSYVLSCLLCSMCFAYCLLCLLLIKKMSHCNLQLHKLVNVLQLPMFAIM